MWPDRRLLALFKTEFPIVLAPMAGVMDTALVIAAAQGGALGSPPCAMLSVEKAREQVNIIRQRISAPVNMNFFCHGGVEADRSREAGWKARLAPYYEEFGLDPAAPVTAANRAPFDAAMCELVEELKPEVVSFHFGLPDQALLRRVKAAGCVVISSATIVREAIWLEENGADAIIAQGAEAGGHRGMFLTDNIAEQPGTFALVPQLVDAVKVPVIAAGGIADGRGMAAAFALGAEGVQVGTRFMCATECTIHDDVKKKVVGAKDRDTVVTGYSTGHPVRVIKNRLSRQIEELDRANQPEEVERLGSGKLALAMREGDTNHGSLMAGQAAVLVVRVEPAADIINEIVTEAEAVMAGLGSIVVR